MVDDGLVERLHGLLAEALRRSRTEPFVAPVTVAEIYQDLVPYRAVRSSLGFHMNADYEHTLLRLLAGEGDRVRLDPPEARDELRSELDTPNPNVGLFRKFAACDVWVTATESVEPLPPLEPDLAEPLAGHGRSASAEAKGEAVAGVEPAHVHEGEAAPQPAAGWDAAEWADVKAEEPEAWDEAELLLEEEVEAPDTSAEAQSATSRPPATEQPKATTMLESRKASAVADHATGSCAFCNHSLPGSRVIHFCPFCGADQTMQPCSTCREPLEAGWKFCIACGTRQP
jgi:hypothetical protein